AGLPERVLARAREVLAELERERTVEHLESSEPEQLPLFAPAAPHPLGEALRGSLLTRRRPQPRRPAAAGSSIPSSPFIPARAVATAPIGGVAPRNATRRRPWGGRGSRGRGWG